MLGAGALGGPGGIVQGGRREGGSGWGSGGFREVQDPPVADSC